MMKNKLTFLFLLVTLGVFAQPDTGQQVIPQRHNLKENLDKPYVILISADGFRYDYAEKYNAGNLKRLSNNGIKAKAMIPSFPSNTFPNHYSIVTGMYPSTHGLIDNNFYDPARDATYRLGNRAMVEDSHWYGGLPLWGLAESNGLLAASLFWVGSESNVAGISPTYYYKYHDEFSLERKVEIVKEWLQLPEDIRPHFITLYFPDVDSQGHRFGPEADQTKEAVRNIDRTIGLLVSEIESLNLPNVNFVFVSDHGMLRADIENPIFMPEIDQDKFVVINASSLVRITAKDKNDVLPLYKKLKSEKTDDYRVVFTKKTKKRWHFRYNADDRIGDILLIPDAPKVFAFAGNVRTSPGTHGYDPKIVKEMQATFYAWGPQFKEGKQIKAFKNIHVYPLIAEILGLEITHKIDGKAVLGRKVLSRN